VGTAALGCPVECSSTFSALPLQTLCTSSPNSMQLSWCTWVYTPKRANKGSPIATLTEGSNLQQEEPQWLHTVVVLSSTPQFL
jgi:hypothetical protein